MEATPDNAPHVMNALAAFGAPIAELRQEDFASPGVVYQIGITPGRIGILTELTGLTFAEAWADKVRRPFGEVEVNFIGRESLIRNKRALGRPKDLGDIEGLE